MSDKPPKRSNEKSLTTGEVVREIFLKEMKSVVYDHKGSAYIKFINLAVGIEYLGACLDTHEFTKKNESENRFNSALKKLFPKKYKPFSNSNHKFYLFECFRCPFVHQLRPGKNVVVTHREESKKERTTHLKTSGNGHFVLVLEDFFDDFERACQKLFDLEKKGKLPSLKMKKDYLKLISIENNN